MGALFDIGEGADAEIKEKLNKAFSGTRLQKLQGHWKNKEKLFNDAHRLERFCARKNLHPTLNYGTDNAKGKWYFLLKKILKQATDGTLDGAGQPVKTTDAIKAALTRALDFDSNGITRVVFDAQEQSGALAHFVYPKNNTPGLLVGKTLNIILVCPTPLNDGEVDNPPTDPDPGEQPLPPSISSEYAKPAKKKKTGKKKTGKKKKGRKR
jgi:hypothetical protein